MWLYSTFETHNIRLPIFSGKSLKLAFFLFSVWKSSNIAPKPTDQSSSNPLSRVLLQIFVGGSFIFDELSQLRIVHLRKNVNFYFQKMTNDFHHFFLFIEHPKPNNMTQSDFIGKFPRGKKKFYILPEVQYWPQKKNLT